MASRSDTRTLTKALNARNVRNYAIIKMACALLAHCGLETALSFVEHVGKRGRDDATDSR